LTAPPAAYARRLRSFDATMMVMGGIIGSGIFLNPAIVAQRVDLSALAVGVWAIGGAVAMAGAFVFAELGARFPAAGGGYVYLREALHPLLGFLYGWTLLLVVATGAIAAVAVTFARYAAALAGLGEGVVAPIAVGAILFLTAVNVLGVRPGATTQNVFTLLKIGALAALIVAGLLAPAAPLAAAPSTRPEAGGSIASLGVALLPVLFAYGGWQQTNFVAAEIVEPRRTLPRALLLGVGGVIALYVLANLAYVRTLGREGLAGSLAPAADVLRRAAGPAGATVIAAGIAASTFGFLSLVILVTPRVYQAMAEDGLFFRAAARLHPRFRTPVGALLVQAAWAVGLTLTGTYGQLLDYVVFGDWIFFGLAGVTLFVLRRRAGRAGERNETQAEFRAPGYPWVPALFVAAAAYAVGSSVLSSPRNAAIGGGLIALGVPAFLLWKKRGQAPFPERK